MVDIANNPMIQFNKMIVKVPEAGPNIGTNIHKVCVILTALNLLQAYSISPEDYEYVNDVYDNPMKYKSLDPKLHKLASAAADAIMNTKQNDSEYHAFMSKFNGMLMRLYDGLNELHSVTLK